MADITITKKEYQVLQRQAKAFRLFASRVFESTVGSVKDVVADFRETNIYSDAFLDDLEDGLKQSSYAKKYGTKATKKRSANISDGA